MATSGKGTGIVGYNVQMAVEAEPWPASRKKWSSLMYGFEPDGGRENGQEETHG